MTIFCWKFDYFFSMKYTNIEKTMLNFNKIIAYYFMIKYNQTPENGYCDHYNFNMGDEECESKICSHKRDTKEKLRQLIIDKIEAYNDVIKTEGSFSDRCSEAIAVFNKAVEIFYIDDYE